MKMSYSTFWGPLKHHDCSGWISMTDADVEDLAPHCFERGFLLRRMHVGAIASKRCAELEIQNLGFRHEIVEG